MRLIFLGRTKTSQGLALLTKSGPPAGYSSAPHSTRGGYRKRQGRGWIYWYPGDAAPGAADQHVAEHRAQQVTDGPEEGAYLPAFAESRATYEKNPGLQKMEGGKFRWVHADRPDVGDNAPKLVPNVDDGTKMQIIQELEPLVRNEARNAARTYAVRSQYSFGLRGQEDETITDLQRAGMEGVLHAIDGYKGRMPFAPLARYYVKDFMRLEAARIGRGLSMSERHTRNFKRFIAARVAASIAHRTDSPTNEQIAHHFDLRTRHVDSHNSGAAGDKLVALEDRVQTAKAYNDYLSGNAGSLDDGPIVQAAASSAAHDEDSDAEHRTILLDQVRKVSSVLREMGPLEIDVPSRGRPKADGTTNMTKVRVADAEQLMLMHFGLAGNDEHAVHELASKVPIHIQASNGEWKPLAHRAAQDHIQRFVALGLDRLRTALVDRNTLDVQTAQGVRKAVVLSTLLKAFVAQGAGKRWPRLTALLQRAASVGAATRSAVEGMS